MKTLKYLLVALLLGASASAQNVPMARADGTNITNAAQWRANLDVPSTSEVALSWEDLTGKPTTLSGFGITDGVNTSQLSTTGGANKVLQNDANGNLIMGDWNNGAVSQFLSNGNIKIPDLQGIQWMSPDDGTTAASIHHWFNHDEGGGETLYLSRNLIAIACRGRLQFGYNDSIRDSMCLNMRSGAATNTDTIRSSKAIFMESQTWTGGAGVDSNIAMQVTPLDLSGTNSVLRTYTNSAVVGYSGPDVYANRGNVTGTLVSELGNEGLWHAGSEPEVVTLTPGATATWTLNKYHARQHAALAIDQATTLAFANLVDGMTGTLIVTQPATGSTYNLTLPSGSKTPANGLGAITLSPGNSAVDLLEWRKIGNFIYWILTKEFSGTLETETTDFLSRASIADAGIATDINNLVLSLKNTTAEGGGSLWSRFYAIYPMVGGTSLAHAQNLKANAYNITNSGAWTTGVTHSAAGITGDGSTGFGDTNFNFDAVSAKDSASVYVYCRTPIASLNTGGHLYGAEDLGPDRVCLEHYSTIAIRYHGFHANNVSIMAQTVTGLRRFAFNRSSSTAVQSYRDATQSTLTQTSVGACSYDIYLLGENSQYGSGTKSNATLAFVAFGQSFTANDWTNIRAIETAFQTARGRTGDYP
jgi:hypothetical protein